jgi:serine/threonine protein kinase
MEYAANGSLMRVLRLVHKGCKLPFWNQTGIAIIICGIVLGMHFIHSRGFIHQDLKPGNVLINADGKALIADFGTSRLRECDDTPSGDTGTTHYAAPERYNEEIPTASVDVFSFGLILYEILAGQAVFPDDLTPFEIIRMHEQAVRPEIPDHVYPHIQDLIRRCWSAEPIDRPSFDEILSIIESNHFEIVAEADTAAVQGYVSGVRDWEMESEEASNSSAMCGREGDA